MSELTKELLQIIIAVADIFILMAYLQAVLKKSSRWVSALVYTGKRNDIPFSSITRMHTPPYKEDAASRPAAARPMNGKRFRSSVYYAGFASVAIAQYAVGWLVGIWQLNMAVSFSGIFLLTFLYRARIITRVFTAVSYQVFAMLSELLSYNLMAALGSELDADDDILYILLVSKFFLFAAVVIVTIFVKRKATAVKLKDYICLIVIPIISLAVVIAVTFEAGSAELNRSMTAFFVEAGLLAINLLVYYILENVIEAAEAREKQALMEKQFAFQEQKYEQTSQSFKRISGIIHDTNKHLQFLRECFEQDEKKEALRYIDIALENVGKSYRRINTGHLVIDALVSNAYNNAHLCNIDFKSDIRIEAGKIDIERYDLSVALGNLLDNALEACQKMPMPSERYIHVTIATSETSLVINIVNSKERGGVFEPTTSKPDQFRHGYGLGNVAAIAEKYGGTFTVASEESRFEATAILPMREAGDRSGL